MSDLSIFTLIFIILTDLPTSAVLTLTHTHTHIYILSWAAVVYVAAPPWATETVLSPWLAVDEVWVSYVLSDVVWWKYIIMRCPWCNDYRRRKWTRRHEFKSWTKLIIFHIALIPLVKVWIQLFSLQLWVNSRTDWDLQPWWGN